MQRDDDPVAGAQAAGPSTISDVLATLQLSDDSEAQVTSFVDSLAQGLSGPRFRKLLTYILKFVELNRSKYETLRSEQARFVDIATSNRDELNQILTVLQERLPPVAPVPRVPAVPAMATQPFQAPPPAVPAMATQPSQATLPNMPAVAPQVSQVTEPPAPAASASAPVQPSAFQAVPPPSAPQAAGMGYYAAPSTFTPSIPNQDGTVSRRMDQVGNNVIVTFSGDDEMASKKAKLFGSSAKYDIFTGQDMSKFPEWVAQFLSGVNLFQPTEPNACRIALHLLRDKAAEMSKNVSQQVTMRNLQELRQNCSQMAFFNQAYFFNLRLEKLLKVLFCPMAGSENGPAGMGGGRFFFGLWIDPPFAHLWQGLFLLRQFNRLSLIFSQFIFRNDELLFHDWRYFHQHMNTKIPIFLVKIMLGVIFTKVIKPSFYSAARLSN